MKTSFVKYFSAFAFALLLASSSMAQAADNQPKGFWVIETNVHQRDHAWLRFYDSQKQLLREEKLARKIEITPANKRALNAALKAVVQHEPVIFSLKGKQLHVQTGTELVAK